MLPDISLSPNSLVERKQRNFTQILGGVKPESLIPWRKIGIEKPARLDGEVLRRMDGDVRRKVLDSLQDIALLPVYEGHTFQARTQRLGKVDPAVQEAKWQFMLSVVNDAYGLELDLVDVDVMGSLLSELSYIERGATNPLMPTTHKLRHNPSIHSLHVMGVIQEICADAATILEADAEALAELEQCRKQLQRSALVHDMGELLGELSVASDRSHFSSEQVKAFEEARGLSEAQVFINALENKMQTLRAKQWPDAVVDKKFHRFEHDYEVAEDASQFLGRLHKVCERIQSQEDYVRFQGKDFGHRMSGASASSKHFIMHYVQEPLHGISRGKRSGESLDDLANSFKNERTSKALMEAVNRKAEALQRILQTETEYQPQSYREKLMEGVRLKPQLARA